jgi:hypothetical protein
MRRLSMQAWHTPMLWQVSATLPEISRVNGGNLYICVSGLSRIGSLTLVVNNMLTCLLLSRHSTCSLLLLYPGSGSKPTGKPVI